MIRSALIHLTWSFLVFASPGAFACGQVGPCEVSQPGGKTTVRGYGYGYEGGDRPVALVWTADGSTAGKGQINSEGEFLVEITVPATPGNHQLLVRNGENDSVPVNVTIPVAVAPPHARVLEWVMNTVPRSTMALSTGALGLLVAVLAGGLVVSGRRRSGSRLSI